MNSKYIQGMYMEDSPKGAAASIDDIKSLFQYRRSPKFNPDIQDVHDNYDNQNACLFNGNDDVIKLNVLLGDQEAASEELRRNPSIFNAQDYKTIIDAIQHNNKELISEKITFIRRKIYQELPEKKEFLRGRMSDVNLETFMNSFYADRTAKAASEEIEVNSLQKSIDENKKSIVSLQNIQASNPTPKTAKSILSLEKKIKKEEEEKEGAILKETEMNRLKEETKYFLDLITQMEGETDAEYNERVGLHKSVVFNHLYDEFIDGEKKFDHIYERYKKIKAAEKGKDKLRVNGIEVVMLPPKGLYLKYGLQQLPFLMDCTVDGDIKDKSYMDLDLYITPYFSDSGRFQTDNKKVVVVWGRPNERWTERAKDNFFPEIGEFKQPSKIGTGIFSAGNPSKAIKTIQDVIRESLVGNGSGGGGNDSGGGKRLADAKGILQRLAVPESEDLLKVCFFNKNRTIDEINHYKYRASVMMLQLNPEFNIKNHILCSDTVITDTNGKNFKWSFVYSKTTPTHVIFFFMNDGIAYTVTVEVSFRTQSKSLSSLFGNNIKSLFQNPVQIQGIKPSIVQWAEALKLSFLTDYPPIGVQKPYLLPMVSTAGSAAALSAGPAASLSAGPAAALSAGSAAGSAAALSGGSAAALSAGSDEDIGIFIIEKEWRIVLQVMLDLDKLHDSASYRLKKAGVDEAEINKIHAALIEKINERIEELMIVLVSSFMDGGVPDDFMAFIPDDPKHNFLYRFCGSLRCFFMRDFSSSNYEITVLMFFLNSIKEFVKSNGEFEQSGIPAIQRMMQGEGLWANNAAIFPRYEALYPRGSGQNPVLCNLGTAFDGGTDLTPDPITIMINRGIRIIESGTTFMEYIPKQGLCADVLGKDPKDIREWFEDSVTINIQGKVYKFDPFNKIHNADVIRFELNSGFFNSRGDHPTDKKALCDLSQHFFLLDYGDHPGDVPCGLVQNDLMSGIFEMVLLLATMKDLKGVKMVGIWCSVRVLWFRIEKTVDNFSIQLYCVSECLNVKKSEIIEDDDSDGEDDDSVPAPVSSVPLAPPVSSASSSSTQSGGFIKRKKTKRRKLFNKSKTQGNKWRGKGGMLAESLPQTDLESDLDTICYNKLVEQLDEPENIIFKEHIVFHVFAYRYLMMKGGILCSLEEYIKTPMIPTQMLLELYDIHFFRSMRLAEYMMDPDGDIYDRLLGIDHIERLIRDGFNKQMIIQKMVMVCESAQEEWLLKTPDYGPTNGSMNGKDELVNLLELSKYNDLCKKNWDELTTTNNMMIEIINKYIISDKVKVDEDYEDDEIDNFSIDGLNDVPFMIQRSKSLESIKPEYHGEPKKRWQDYHVKRLMNLESTMAEAAEGGAMAEASEGGAMAEAAEGSAKKGIPDKPKVYYYLPGNGRQLDIQTNKNRTGCLENGLFNVPLTKPFGILEISTRLIQAGIRGFQVRKTRKIKENKATKIQARFRNFQARKTRKIKEKKATILQARFRGFKTRKNKTKVKSAMTNVDNGIKSDRKRQLNSAEQQSRAKKRELGRGRSPMALHGRNPPQIRPRSLTPRALTPQGRNSSFLNPNEKRRKQSSQPISSRNNRPEQ